MNILYKVEHFFIGLLNELNKIYKRQTYDEQKEWLLQNTAYFAGDVSDEFKPVEDVDDLA